MTYYRIITNMNTDYLIKKQAVYTKHRQIMKYCQMCRNAFHLKVSRHDGRTVMYAELLL